MKKERKKENMQDRIMAHTEYGQNDGWSVDGQCQNSAVSKLSRNAMDNQNNPMISIIVPVYNMEKYLERCVNSILKQTYDNIEIILVNDCSTDDSAQIIDRLAKSDCRVKTVCHAVNRGLFQARLTGFENAAGEYVAFVDSDDYVSVDWFRTLVRKAEETSSDIVVGEWCFDFDGLHRDYCNLDHFRLNDYNLEGSQIMDNFMAVQGRNFSWTVVWNKLYSRELWVRCFDSLNMFSEKHGHMLMWEDIAFSAALWMHAKRVTNVHGASYFYFKHEGASTHNTVNRKRNLKYIQDASAAISFMEEMLKKADLYRKYEKEFIGWNLWGIGTLYKDLVIDLNKPEYKRDIQETFHCSDYEYEKPESFFYSITTPLHESFEWLETLKREIASPKTQYVSFDVFDTLVSRPFFYPTDLFQLLSEKINRNRLSYINFKVIREEAERTVRQQQELMHPSVEEITFDDIYQYIQEHYIFDADTINEIKQMELDLELRYCTVRNSGKALLDFAVECGKKVIICSDMYLPGSFVAKILEKNGITNYDKLYLSSDIGLTKARKSLYKFVQRDLDCKNADALIHIGDNWSSDVENAKKCGWRSAHLSKASDMVLNSNPGVYGGEAFHKLYRNAYFKEDYRLAFDDFTAIRTMTALSANRFFDNPYMSINPWSDFNADPCMIGYTALGPHLLALCQWIHKNVIDKKIGTVHFVARDGYLVKKAYDNCFPDSRTNYLRISRKALILCDIHAKEDIYSLYNKMKPNASPKEFAEYLMPIIPKDKRSELSSLLKREGFLFDRKLKSLSEWADCLKVFAEQIIDLSMLPSHKAKLKAYFSQFIQPGDYIFDVGYSGRPESALSDILGFPVGSMYIHVNSEIAEIRQEKHHCPHEVFYDFKPCITGTVREHLLMELAPSTIGFHEVNGSLEPLFEPYEEDYCSVYITSMIQDYALRFVKEYNALFGEFKTMYFFQHEAASAPFEYYMHCSKHIDRAIVAPICFEDDLGSSGEIRLLDFWDKELNTRNIGLSASSIDSDISGDVIPGLYVDGQLMKFIKFVNRVFPRGGRMREVLKIIAGFISK